MKGVLSLSVLGLFVLFCGCQPQPDLVLDSFEGEITSKTVDFGSAEGSSVDVKASSEINLCGEQSLQVDYELKPSGYMWIARGYDLDVEGAAAWLVSPQEIDWPKYNALKVSMYGGNSGGVVALDIKDSGGEMWRFLLDDDYQGWKEIVCPFEEFFPRKDWQPDDAKKNDIIDYPVKSFQFEPRLPGKGVFYFDCVKLGKVKK